MLVNPNPIDRISRRPALPARPVALEDGALHVVTASETVQLRSVALPSEHGGWSLTLEPVLLGSIVAPTVTGLALGVAALAAFLTRTPLKLVLVDRWRRRNLPRTRLALKVALVYVTMLILAVLVASLGAEGRFWVPLGLALPLVVVGLWFDMRSKSRRLIPELAGTIGIGSVAGAIIVAGGGDWTSAFVAWGIVSLRAIATIPFVRTQLARAKRPSHGTAQSDVAQLATAGMALIGWASGVVPEAASAVICLLAMVQVVLTRTRPPRAAVIGAQQVVLGLTVVLVSGLGLVAP